MMNRDHGRVFKPPVEFSVLGVGEIYSEVIRIKDWMLSFKE
jgi:hypothetical protein